MPTGSILLLILKRFPVDTFFEIFNCLNTPRYLHPAEALTGFSKPGMINLAMLHMIIAAAPRETGTIT